MSHHKLRRRGWRRTVTRPHSDLGRGNGTKHGLRSRVAISPTENEVMGHDVKVWSLFSDERL